VGEAPTAGWAGRSVSLYGKGEAVAARVDSGGAAYFGKDVLGSVRTVTGEYGQIEERYEYDAFGKPYQGEFDHGLNLGYTGKPYDTATGLYDYGYRDYAPEAARFTTVDPARDGANWFAYVNNDPVNWIDPWGLRPLTQEERDLHAAAGGGPVDYDNINVEDRIPIYQEVRNALERAGIDTAPYADYHIQDIIDEHPAMSLPGTIYQPVDPNRTVNENKAMMAHEIEHQAQYQNGINGSTRDIFEQLIHEAQRGPSVYSDPTTLESKAQQVEDNANVILNNSSNNCGW
jgi:RHS repeat-associated protein